MARASKKNCQLTSQSGVSGGDGGSSGKNKGTFSHNEEKENVDPGLGGKMNGANGGPADVVRISDCVTWQSQSLSSLSLSRPQLRRWPVVVSWLDWVTLLLRTDTFLRLFEGLLKPLISILLTTGQ